MGGLLGNKPEVTLFFVVATQSNGASADEVRNAVSGPDGHSVKPIEIAGKEFWKAEVLREDPEGKNWNIAYATALNGYILQFKIASFDGKLTEQLEHCIEAISFFDPARAKELAGSDSRPYNPKVSP